MTCSSAVCSPLSTRATLWKPTATAPLRAPNLDDNESIQVWWTERWPSPSLRRTRGARRRIERNADEVHQVKESLSSVLFITEQNGLLTLHREVRWGRVKLSLPKVTVVLRADYHPMAR